MNNKLLKKIVKYYLNEDDDLYTQQLDHKIDQLQKHTEQIQSQIDNLKNSIDHLKQRKEKITDEISRLRLKKQQHRLQDKGII